MFNGLQLMAERFAELEDNIQVFAATVMNDEQTIAEITELNREQLYAGERSDGSAITPPYTSFTDRIKKQKGQPTDRVTLDDTGDFYAALRVKTSPGKSEVYDTDWKSDQLEAKYNSGDAVIFGLAPEYIDRLRNFIFGDFKSFSQNYFRI